MKRRRTRTRTRTQKRLPPGLAALARKGLVTLGMGNNPNAYPVLPRALRHHTAAELLAQERGQ